MEFSVVIAVPYSVRGMDLQQYTLGIPGTAVSRVNSTKPGMYVF